MLVKVLPIKELEAIGMRLIKLTWKPLPGLKQIMQLTLIRSVSTCTSLSSQTFNLSLSQVLRTELIAQLMKMVGSISQITGQTQSGS